MSGKMEQELDRYFLPRELLSANRKSDGNIYHTYQAWSKEEYGHDRKSSRYIIKEISESQSEIYRTLSHIQHPNLETVYGILSCNGQYCAINEYIPPPVHLLNNSPPNNSPASISLENYIKDYNGSLDKIELSLEKKTQQAFIILLQISEALKEIHNHGLIHGDIHPGNILLTDFPSEYHHSEMGNCDFFVKLIDFDNTQIAKNSDHAVTRLIGAKPFAAPEILDFTHALDRADIYSLGCILYYTICGESPKEGELNNGILHDKWAKRIFRRCTASYEARYKNISALIKDLKRALWIPPNAVIAFLHNLPGFRNRRIWTMMLASYIYISIIATAICTIYISIRQGSSFAEERNYQLFVLAMLVTEIVIVCDAFQIGDHFPRYVYLRNAHPFFRYLIKLGIAIAIFVAFLLLSAIIC